jgi:hypothetical protein
MAECINLRTLRTFKNRAQWAELGIPIGFGEIIQRDIKVFQKETAEVTVNCHEKPKKVNIEIDVLGDDYWEI